MSKERLRRCNKRCCPDYTEHKLKPACSYGGGLRQVKYNGPCVFELSSTITEPSETDSELAQPVQQVRAPWMQYEEGEPRPSDRPDGH